ncbi:L-threonine 3-dehydrogenase-like [Styela clava]
MNCLLKRTEAEGYEWVTTPIPEACNDEVLIKVDKVAICGSDISLWKWNETAKLIASLPFTPGHEATGTVVKVGPNAARLTVGDRIAVENHFFCGKCLLCSKNRGDICQNLSQYGHGRGTIHGGCSQYSIVNEKYCYKLQHNITDNEAVLLEPMGVAHNGIERLDVSGEEVLVIGCGAVGLFAIACAKALGATRVIAADIVPDRLIRASKMGADVVINSKDVKDFKDKIMELTDGNGIDRICEASGSAFMLNRCFSYLRKGGKVVLIGLVKEPFHVENPIQDIVFKSLTINTVHGRRIFHTWEECEKLIVEKKVDPSIVISHDIPMSKFRDAFNALFSQDACKIVLDPQN